MQIITPEILQRLKESPKALNRLAYEFNKHRTTIERWVANNDPMLTTETAQVAICEELEIEKTDLLTEA